MNMPHTGLVKTIKDNGSELTNGNFCEQWQLIKKKVFIKAFKFSKSITTVFQPQKPRKLFHFNG